MHHVQVEQGKVHALEGVCRTPTRWMPLKNAIRRPSRHVKSGLTQFGMASPRSSYSWFSRLASTCPRPPQSLASFAFPMPVCWPPWPGPGGRPTSDRQLRREPRHPTCLRGQRKVRSGTVTPTSQLRFGALLRPTPFHRPGKRQFRATQQEFWCGRHVVPGGVPAGPGRGPAPTAVQLPPRNERARHSPFPRICGAPHASGMDVSLGAVGPA